MISNMKNGIESSDFYLSEHTGDLHTDLSDSYNLYAHISKHYHLLLVLQKHLTA